MCAETVIPPATQQSIFRSLFVDIERMIPSCDHVRSLQYLLSRLEKEGDQFVLSVLPLLGKAVERALILEEPLKVPLGWRLRRGTRLPLFLNSLFTRVFEDNGAPIRPSGDPTALLLIRQVCLIYSKVEGCVEDALAQAKLQEFKSRTTGHPKIEWMPEYNLAHELLGRVFDRNDPNCAALVDFERNPWGRHGPGAVADRSSAYEKWEQFSRWKGIPPALFTVGSASLVSKVEDYRPIARVITVPKDFRGPRVICIEPKEFQFAQQGLMEILYKLVRGNSLMRRSISFKDVEPSRRLCWRQDVATIDLKDASDRLSLSLARILLPKWVFALVTRYRSNRIGFDNHIWSPTCLATMGNATCFPLQTIIFWALARATMVGLQPYNACPRTPLRVFGDDIIVPKQASSRLLDVLEAAGFLVNHDKTCLRTLVKESCGAWVYGQRDLSIVRLKTLGVSRPSERIAARDYSIVARKQGLVSLASTLDPDPERQLVPRRWNKKLQRIEVHDHVLASTGRRKALDGYTGLYAWFVHNDTAPFLHGTLVKVKRRWVAMSKTA